MAARCLMIQGTASSVGKSLMVTGLCRLFARQGVKVAPFKSQNLSLNAAVTPSGHEIGRATAVQAEAAGIPATVAMNPVLLKPEGPRGCQVILMGRPQGPQAPGKYLQDRSAHRAAIEASLARLRAEYDLILCEGAGSPAEPNLMAHDIANMYVARIAEAPVLLVGDIDRGGVFASLVGTLALLPEADRARVKGFIINKFRGEARLLKPALDILQERTGLPTLGVMPHLRGLRIAEEDGVALEGRSEQLSAGEQRLDVAVLRYPSISNFDDLGPLELERGVAVRYVQSPEALGDPDLLILPGSKCTAADLAWVRAQGLAGPIKARCEAGRPTLGICGGFQMMGQRIEDPMGVEGPPGAVDGLGILPVRTTFAGHKVTRQVRARAQGSHLLAGASEPSPGYEIHMGRVERLAGAEAAFRLEAPEQGTSLVQPGKSPQGSDPLEDGATLGGGLVMGTLIHGLFEDEALRRGLLQRLGAQAQGPSLASRAQSYDRLADALEAHLDQGLLRQLALG